VSVRERDLRDRGGKRQCGGEREPYRKREREQEREEREREREREID
jgi:hypothetical protein